MTKTDGPRGGDQVTAAATCALGARATPVLSACAAARFCLGPPRDALSPLSRLSRPEERRLGAHQPGLSFLSGNRRTRNRSRGQSRPTHVKENTIKFEGDFDFESANAQFNREELDKEFKKKLNFKGLACSWKAGVVLLSIVCRTGRGDAGAVA